MELWQREFSTLSFERLGFLCISPGFCKGLHRSILVGGLGLYSHWVGLPV